MFHRNLFLKKRPQLQKNPFLSYPKMTFLGSVVPKTSFLGTSVFYFKKLEFFLSQKQSFWDKLSIEIIYKKRTYDARLGEISSDSYGKSYSTC